MAAATYYKDILLNVTPWFAPVLLFLSSCPANSRDVDFFTVVDAGVALNDGGTTWLNGGLGKARDDEDGVVLDQALLGVGLHVTDTLTVRAVGSYYTDPDAGPDTQFGVTEAWLHYRPIPRSDLRYEIRAGAFLPPFSMENITPGWLSPYTWTPSAINTWFGEELRTVGMEARVERMGKFSGSPHDFSLTASVFGFNDPAGSLLAWRGWSMHGRQSRLFESVPFTKLPAFQSSRPFELQSQWDTPFLEVDDEIGYYLQGEWDYGRRSELTVAWYDNRGIPTALSDSEGQYAWHTRFIHLGWHLTLPRDFEFIAQYINGDTGMGMVWQPRVTGVVVDFESFFLLLTKQFGSHRFSVRYDNFSTDDHDNTFMDDNDERGHAWTLAYFWNAKPNLRLGLEWLQIDSRRSARGYIGQAAVQQDSHLFAGVRWRFDSAEH